MTRDDIEHVLNALGGDGEYKVSGDHVMASCVLAPWTHSSGIDEGRKLGVRLDAGAALVNCFYPGCFHGTLLKLVHEVGAHRMGEGSMTLAEVSDLKAFVMLAEDEDQAVGSTRAAPVVHPIPGSVLAAVGTGSPYWVSRGITPQTALSWKLGEAGGRALLPLCSTKGVVLAVQGRLLPGLDADAFSDDRSPHDEKYRTWPAGFVKSEHLFGEHQLARPVDVLVVVESPFDAIALSEWLDGELPGTLAVVASLGAKVASAQIDRLVQSVAVGGEIILGFDRDNAGRLGQRQLLETLYKRVPNCSIVTWAGNDPTDTDGGRLDARLEAKRSLHARKGWLALRLGAMLQKT